MQDKNNIQDVPSFYILRTRYVSKFCFFMLLEINVVHNSKLVPTLQDGAKKCFDLLMKHPIFYCIMWVLACWNCLNFYEMQ